MKNRKIRFHKGPAHVLKLIDLGSMFWNELNYVEKNCNFQTQF